MRVYLYLLLLLAASPLTAQYAYKINISSGYGQYNMDDLKSLQQEFLEDFPEDARITEAFPGYAYFEASVSQRIQQKVFVSFYGAYGSTGGRVHYRDYSGEVGANQLVTYFSFGFPVSYTVLSLQNNTLTVSLEAKPMVTIGRLTLEFYSKLGNSSEEQSYKFKANNLCFEPGVRIEKRIGQVGANVFIGYNANFSQGKLFFTEQDDAYLQDSEEDAVTMDLSGLRASIGISFAFGKN